MAIDDHFKTKHATEDEIKLVTESFRSGLMRSQADKTPAFL